MAGSTQLQEGREFAERMTDWIVNRGPDVLANIVAAAVIFIAGLLLIKFAEFIMRKALSKKKTKKLMIDFAVSALVKTSWAILIVTILSRLGVNVAPLVAGLGVTGFILGFAFQESLGNLAAGLMIAVNEPFKPGDFVEAAGLQGSILEMNMMATVMTTPDNKKIVVPNKSVWGGPITNYSAMSTRRIDLSVGIAYGEDIEKAIDVVRETIVRVEGVLAQPEPSVAAGALSDSQVTINFRPWSSTKDYWTVRSKALVEVKKALDSAGIEIPFPQITVHRAEA